MWERRARAIPDPVLRALAVKALRAERGNLEGAAAFAAFVPRLYRRAVTRAAVAFQAAYDYVDVLTESHQQRGHSDNTACLHSSLVDAVCDGHAYPDYYAYSAYREDNGYLRALVDRCRSELIGLPAYSVAVPALRRAARRIGTYQHFHHSDDPGRDNRFAAWATTEVSLNLGLRWWEVAASAGSSLAVFALMTSVSRADADSDLVCRIEQAYFPWIGSLHTLLDSLVDRKEDRETGQPSLIDHYESAHEGFARFEFIVGNAAREATSIDGYYHSLLLSAMVGFYLSKADNRDPWAHRIGQLTLSLLGRYTAQAMLVLRVERSALKILRMRPWRQRRKTSSQ